MIPPRALLLELQRTAPDTSLVVTVADLVAYGSEVLTESGPQELSTVTAARFLGRTPKWWREHGPKVRAWWRSIQARSEFEGAWTDEVGKWRFTQEAARGYLAELRRRQDGPAACSSLPARRTRRGPRRQAA